jgi:Zn-dependent protease
VAFVKHATNGARRALLAFKSYANNGAHRALFASKEHANNGAHRALFASKEHANNGAHRALFASGGYPVAPPNFAERQFYPALIASTPHKYWLHALLLLATLVTTTVLGCGLERSFAQNQPLDFVTDLSGYTRVLHDPGSLTAGLPFSLTLLMILLAHEAGHYVAARYYRVDASLPYFLPMPIFTFIGTMGAFIRIRSAILSRKSLFDIGIAGPIAGFVMLLAPLVTGVSLSRVVPGIAERGEVILGTPLLLRLVEMVQFPGVPTANISLHPVAYAAWVGLLATAMNLLPIGQLDGGHILYSFIGDWAKYTSRLFIVCLAAMGFYQIFTTSYKAGYSWLLWAVLLMIFGTRNPSIIDPRPVKGARAWLGVFSFVMFVLCFTPVPLRTTGL